VVDLAGKMSTDLKLYQNWVRGRVIPHPLHCGSSFCKTQYHKIGVFSSTNLPRDRDCAITDAKPFPQDQCLGNDGRARPSPQGADQAWVEIR